MRKLPLSVPALLLLTPGACHVRAVHAAQDAALQQPSTIPAPADYREWVYMTSGLDMNYAPAAANHQTGPHTPVFDNVFVNPEAWHTFKQTGTWPDGTTFVLENRTSEQNVSINRDGHTQSKSVDGIELHQKRSGQWAFYTLGSDGAEHLVAKPAGCYTCHEAHAAVDTTFAQFYPTAMPIAQTRNTVSRNYLAEIAAATQK